MTAKLITFDAEARRALRTASPSVAGPVRRSIWLRSAAS
jgi:hypothetical protein